MIRHTALLLIVAATASAQQQESEMLRRILSPPSQEHVSALQNVTYDDAGSFESRSFAIKDFGGVQDASVAEFPTKSFLGIKNPWFGKSVVETPTAVLADRSDAAGSKAFGTNEFATDSATRIDRAAEIRNVIPTARAVTLEEMTRDGDLGVSQFTQNLEKDLSIDEVRDLLNKNR